jgi:hypothetical protein
MKEEVNLEGDFTFRIIATDEPAYLEVHNFWQLRLIFAITPSSYDFSAGDDGDERRIYRYYKEMNPSE